jgi:hypothetical protein
MTPPPAPARSQNPRCPGEMICPGVGLSEHFPLRARAVQKFWCERGLDVTHEALWQGVGRVGRRTRSSCSTDAPSQGTRGTWMRGSGPSTGSALPCGMRWIRTITCWICWGRAGATSTPRQRFAARCSRWRGTGMVSREVAGVSLHRGFYTDLKNHGIPSAVNAPNLLQA